MNMDPFSFIVAILVYVAVLVFIIGMSFKIVVWIKAPRMQIQLGMFPKPKNRFIRFFKILKDSFIFPQVIEVDKWMWIFAVLFHLALLIALAGHFRLIREFTFISNIIGQKNLNTLGAVGGGTVGIIMVFALVYYLFRRFASPYKEISVPEDFILIILLAAIIGLGDHMRFFGNIHTEEYRKYFLSILQFKPSFPEALVDSQTRWVLSWHVLSVNLFVIYFPFSKLVHVIGTFFANKVRSE
jgi:nitrate reductase gamma subunit